MTRDYEPLHPESLETLRQLVKLHGGARVVCAVFEILGMKETAKFMMKQIARKEAEGSS